MGTKGGNLIIHGNDLAYFGNITINNSNESNEEFQQKTGETSQEATKKAGDHISQDSGKGSSNNKKLTKKGTTQNKQDNFIFKQYGDGYNLIVKPPVKKPPVKNPPTKNLPHDGDVTTDGNYTYEGGASKTLGKWVTTEQWIKDKYKISPYSGKSTDPKKSYAKEYPEYLQTGKNAVYLRKVFSDLGKKYNISGYELYAVAMGEGLGFLLDILNKYNINPDSIMVSGFVFLGTDNFANDADRLRKKKLLPDNFRGDSYYRPKDYKNEAKQVVPSAEFTGLTNALTGFAAVYAERQQTVVADGIKLGYPSPSEDEKRFWTYVYFNPGRDKTAFEQLKENGSFHIKNMKFNRTDEHPAGVHSKAYKRVATEKYVEKKGKGLIK
jgi:hypothetical protein